jgi:exodeoxyribonuclease VII large subunit
MMMSVLNDARKIYSLLEISSGIRQAVSKAFPDYYWVKAEIARLNFYPKSGHCYPDLVEKQNGMVKAQLRANIWAGNYNEIQRKFKAVTGEPLKDGLKILFLAKVNYHEHYGLALNIVDVEPSFTLGEMAREKQLTIYRLKQEGLLDENKKRHMPLVPKRIAVISVETSKGYSDFMNVLENNPWHYRFSVSLFPALLQGDGAVPSIGGQLQRIATQRSDFDVVAIIRGGGGDVGLNAYDNYSLAKAVAVCPLPVITGIGHSTNQTVVQMVAFANKITPTEAAHFLLQQFHHFSERLENAENTLVREVLGKIDDEKQHFARLSKMFQVHTRNLFDRQKTQWGYLMKRIEQSGQRVLTRSEERLSQSVRNLQQQPERLWKFETQKLANIRQLMDIRLRQQISQAKDKLLLLESKVELMRPEKILKKGYSISLVEGKPVTLSSEVKPGQKMITRLYKGEIESVIEKRKK